MKRPDMQAQVQQMSELMITMLPGCMATPLRCTCLASTARPCNIWHCGNEGAQCLLLTVRPARGSESWHPCSRTYSARRAPGPLRVPVEHPKLNESACTRMLHRRCAVPCAQEERHAGASEYRNDPKTLAAIGERMGDVPALLRSPPAPGPASAAAAAPRRRSTTCWMRPSAQQPILVNAPLQALPGAASAQNMQGVAQKRIGWF